VFVGSFVRSLTWRRNSKSYTSDQTGEEVCVPDFFWGVGGRPTGEVDVPVHFKDCAHMLRRRGQETRRGHVPPPKKKKSGKIIFWVNIM